MPFMGLLSEDYSLAGSRGCVLGLLCDFRISLEQGAAAGLQGTQGYLPVSSAHPRCLSDSLTQAATAGTLTTEYYRISDCFVRVCF